MRQISTLPVFRLKPILKPSDGEKLTFTKTFRLQKRVGIWWFSYRTYDRSFVDGTPEGLIKYAEHLSGFSYLIVD